jgi:hypothetical protein
MRAQDADHPRRPPGHERLDGRRRAVIVGNAELERNDARQQLVGLAQLALWIACAIAFIRWLRAAYRNVDVVAPGLRRHGHGWAIGGWFVPILSL